MPLTPESEHSPVLTQQMVNALAELRTSIEKSNKTAEEALHKASQGVENRHTTNGALQDLLLTMEEAGQLHGRRLDVLEVGQADVKAFRDVVQKVVGDIGDIKSAIVGNDALKTEGIAQKLNQTVARMLVIEEKQVDVMTKLVVWHRVAVTGVVVVGAIGSIVAWGQATKFFHWIATTGT